MSFLCELLKLVVREDLQLSLCVKVTLCRCLLKFFLQLCQFLPGVFLATQSLVSQGVEFVILDDFELADGILVTAASCFVQGLLKNSQFFFGCSISSESPLPESIKLSVI
jgi:hypothetical protein